MSVVRKIATPRAAILTFINELDDRFFLGYFVSAPLRGPFGGELTRRRVFEPRRPEAARV
jgi:hypothetical protein